MNRFGPVTWEVLPSFWFQFKTFVRFGMYNFHANPGDTVWDVINNRMHIVGIPTCWLNGKQVPIAYVLQPGDIVEGMDRR